MGRRVALTGTPGTGKSTVGRLLSRGRRVTEVADLATRLGSAERARDGVVVDMDRLVRSLRGHSSAFDADIVTGHLAHLLPIRDVVVLRCHPVELGRRLALAHRGDDHSRNENMLAESVGVVTAEALAQRRTVFEIDTTGKTAVRVAREVSGWMRGTRGARWGRVDWLREPSVTEHLLEWTR